MILVNELRIGNLVYVDNEDCHPQLKDIAMKVIGIYQNQNGWCVNLEHINQKPNTYYETYSQKIDFIQHIQLSEEILLKCGFEWSKHYAAYIHDNLHIEIKQNTGEGYWKIDPFSKEYDNKWYLTSEAEYTVSETPIEYLHQLQNLYFALTSKELEIKL